MRSQYIVTLSVHSCVSVKCHQVFIIRFVVVVLGIWWKSCKVKDCVVFLAFTYKGTSCDVVQIEEQSIFSGVNVGCLRTITAAFRCIAGGSCLPSACRVL